MAFASCSVLLLSLVFAALASAAPAAAPGPAAKGETVHLKVLSVYDTGVGTEAFRMLIPSDWRAEGGILWRHEFSNLATPAMRISRPDGAEALEMFPITPHVWTEGGIPFFPVGSNYLGNIVLPVIPDPTSYVRHVALPQFRKQVTARIVDRQQLPEVAQAVAAAVQEQGVSKTVRAERVRLEYQEGSRWMHEDAYCVLVYAQSPTLPGTTFWGPDRLFSFKAEKERLDGLNGLFRTMVSSVKPNPVWFSKYLQVVSLWQQGQMQAIRSAGELSRYISRTSDEISAIHRQAFEQQQAATDRVNRNFSQYIRGVETYQNPLDGRPVELPSGYRGAWVSRQGEYILSNDPNFNPDVGSAQAWQQMKHQR